ncbi:aldo/keto reductase [Haloarcula pellucida]|uniref:aldo/keto reductase n=1 Tax=Haloarcula pellucida TaxID=1427151 RepID=UPI00166F2289|nr:aldo/keto reductase [Halomicroarcula pellucida]MBX0349791.1 aldo/keto reductase [Halomicroarcula pellucida]
MAVPVTDLILDREGQDVFDQQTRLGLGTYSLTGETGRDTIAASLDVGYRHLDTARLYENEREVGEAIADSDVDRDDLFVATKVAHFEEPAKTESYVRRAVAESFDRLGLERIDLLYHHWPRSQGDIETVLPVLEEYVQDGVVDHLGVSNYTIADMELARDLVDVPIDALQVEMHPLLQQDELRDFLSDTVTQVVAYSPLAQGEVFEVDAISAVAEKHGVSEAVVTLAWLLSKDDVAAIPRTSSVDHLRDNFEALSVDLDAEDIARIDDIERTHRCEDPDWMSW